MVIDINNVAAIITGSVPPATSRGSQNLLRLRNTDVFPPSRCPVPSSQWAVPVSAAPIGYCRRDVSGRSLNCLYENQAGI